MFQKIAALLFIILPVMVYPQSDILDEYIRKGLENNLALKQKKLELQKGLAALDEARGFFMPSVSISARYSMAGGGREISIPVGDLMNPVYTTLNQLLQQNRFPSSIENETIPFLREKEHDTKVSLTQPLFKPEILYNYRIKSEMVEINRAEKQLFRRQLIRDIKTAYYNFLKAKSVENLYKSTEKLLEENLRVNEALVKNQKATKEVIFRAQAELTGIIAEKENAAKNVTLAKQYFNFLLNRPLDDDIAADENIGGKGDRLIIPGDTEFPDNREELFQLEKLARINEYQADISRAGYFPGLVFALDYGFQGEEYKFTSDYDYWMASLVFNWNIFNGFRDSKNVEQALIEKKKTETAREELLRKIGLQLRRALEELKVAKSFLKRAAEKKESAGENYRIVAKKYSEGMVPLVEYTDARNTLTAAETEKIIAEYDLLTKLAEFEYVSATEEMKEK